jgi:NTP pyrophosphatase (non-canonical NTP hydrolase)
LENLKFGGKMKDQETKVQELKDRMKAFVEARNWTSFHSPKNIAMSIAIEAAELMEIFQWATTEEAWQIKDSDEFVHLKEELSDVLLYCISLASQLDIDITEAIEDKMVKNAKKYPEHDKVNV